MVWERITVRNVTSAHISLAVTEPSPRLDKTRGPFGDNVTEYLTTFLTHTLYSGGAYIYAAGIYENAANTPTPCEDFEHSYARRCANIDRLASPLALDTGNKILDTAAEMLLRYVENRLLGERVPYPVEAYPEGNRCRLSG